jgi:hypothetical protein
MFEVDLGKIKFKWRGAYDATVGYTVDDVVRYNNNNYVCTADNGNTLPDVAPSVGTPFWDLMTQGVEAPVGTPADKDVIVYDGTNSQQVYQRPTGVVAINEHTFPRLGQVNSGNALPVIGTYYDVNNVYNASNVWTPISTYLQDAIDKTADAEMYPWCVFSPTYDDSSRKVELKYFVGKTDTSSHLHFRVFRHCVEDATEVRAIATNPWATAAVAPDSDYGYYSYSDNAATFQYQQHPVYISFVDATPLDPTKHYYYSIKVEGSSSPVVHINYNIAYYSQTYGAINVSNTIITEFRNPS